MFKSLFSAMRSVQCFVKPCFCRVFSFSFSFRCTLFCKVRLFNSLHAHFYAFCRLLIFVKINSSKISFRNTVRVSNGLDPDQARRFVGPDLVLNCW